MKIKTVEVAKSAIQELSGDELDLLVKFGKSKEFEVFTRLSDREKYKRYQRSFLSAESLEEVNMLKGINIGIDFILDSVKRAKDELKRRGAEEDEIDNDTDIK